MRKYGVKSVIYLFRSTAVSILKIIEYFFSFLYVRTVFELPSNINTMILNTLPNCEPLLYNCMSFELENYMQERSELRVADPGVSWSDPDSEKVRIRF